MNKLRRVVNNTIISLAGQAVTWTSTLLLTIAYGRFLSDIKFGELYFAITFVMLIGFPLEFGFNQQITRDVAQKPDRALRYLSNTLFIKLLLWLVLYTLILLAAWLLGYNREVLTLVAICGVTLLSGSITNTFIASHYAFERVTYPVVGTILEKGLSALFGFILLKYGAGVEVMALVLLGGSLSNGIWQAIWFFRIVGISFAVDLTLMRELFRSSIPFLTYGVLGVIYYRVDTVLLSLMTNAAVVGWYGAAYRLFDTLVFLPSLVISAIMYPVFSKLSISSEADLKVAIEKAMNFLLFCVLPIATTLIVAAPNIIGFLYHRPEYIHTFPVLQALAPGLVFLYINSVLGAVFMSTHQEKKITLMAVFALVFNLGLNLILIPRYLVNRASTRWHRSDISSPPFDAHWQPARGRQSLASLPHNGPSYHDDKHVLYFYHSSGCNACLLRCSNAAAYNSARRHASNIWCNSAQSTSRIYSAGRRTPRNGRGARSNRRESNGKVNPCEFIHVGKFATTILT